MSAAQLVFILSVGVTALVVAYTWKRAMPVIKVDAKDSDWVKHLIVASRNSAIQNGYMVQQAITMTAEEDLVVESLHKKGYPVFDHTSLMLAKMAEKAKQRREGL